MRNLKRFKKLKDKFCGLPVLFLFQFSVFYHPPFNYRWMFVAGRLCKCYYVCIIDNITDIWSPGPGGTGAGVISSHGSGSGHFTDSEQSPVTQRDWTIQHQPTNKTCNVNILEKVERTMIPTLEIPHHPAQRRRSLPRLPDIPCPQQPSNRVQSKFEMKIVHGHGVFLYHAHYSIFN